MSPSATVMCLNSVCVSWDSVDNKRNIHHRTSHKETSIRCQSGAESKLPWKKNNLRICVNCMTNQMELNVIKIHSGLIWSLMVLRTYGRVFISKYQSIKSVLWRHDAEVRPSIYTFKIISLFCVFFWDVGFCIFNGYHHWLFLLFPRHSVWTKWFVRFGGSGLVRVHSCSRAIQTPNKGPSFRTELG